MNELENRIKVLETEVEALKRRLEKLERGINRGINIGQKLEIPRYIG